MTDLGSDNVVTRRLLLSHAEHHPDDRYVLFEDGSAWTWTDVLREACVAADALRGAGVGHGDIVALMLPNGPDFLRAWWGVSMLGAVLAPINTAFRGKMLAHHLNLARPTAVIASADYTARFEGACLDPSILVRGRNIVPDLTASNEFWDLSGLYLTSGTTGASKLSATTYLHCHMGGAHMIKGGGCGPDDVFLADLPLFHLGGMYMAQATLHTRTQLALRTRPELTAYWAAVRQTGATAALLLSTMVTYLMAQPPSDGDRDHGMKIMFTAPLPHDVEVFQARFGIARIQTALGSTEMPGVVQGDPRDPPVYGYCGRAGAGFQLRLVDEHDLEVPVGEPGELLVRPDLPWSMTAGYVGNAEATAEAWRNGWFHSGDRLRRDEEGRYFFVDRAKDSIRRRGENVSSAEVEAELGAHPDVTEVACVAYREEGWNDDELKAWIVAAPGAQVDYESLLRFCLDRLPHFMVPRYFELTETLPKTASLRVQKFHLRERGNSPATWDREAHGLTVTRDGITKAPAGATA